MARPIIKLTDDKTGTSYYMEWSEVCDAPYSYGMSLEDFKYYYLCEYGREGMEDLTERLYRVEKYGVSTCFHDSEDEIIKYNRAGKNDKTLTKEQILQKFCRTRKG